MGFGDILARKFFKFNGGSQVQVGITSPYVLAPADDQFIICDPAAPTKCARFDAAGVTAGQTRVFSFADVDSGGATGARKNVVLGSTVLTLTDALSGSTVVMDAGAQAYVLPALTASNSGANGIYFDFETQTTASAVTITAGAGDILHGGVSIMSTGAGVENDAFSANGTSDLVITMNGTTKGGIIGSRLRLEAWSATAWLVSGNLIGSGTLVTPFS